METTVKDFQRLFFSMTRLSSFPWRFLEENLQSNKSSPLVSDILNQTCLHSLCRKFPPSVRYRRLFLSELVRRQEAAGCEPLDELYDTLAEVLGSEDAAEFCYKSYLLPGGAAVSLLESVALISQGTTGLVTWESALYLAEWALDHPQTFAGRTVVELGSGVGLTGVTICRSCSPLRFVFSDCHPAVLHKLRANVELNGSSAATAAPPAVSVERLDWKTTASTVGRLQEIGADVVIAADVTYDPDIVGHLVALLSGVLRGLSPEVLICSTVRNQETYDGFKTQLRSAGIVHHVMTGGVSRVFPYDRASNIEMIRLQRRQQDEDAQ